MQLGAALHHVNERMAEQTVGVGHQRVLADDERHLGQHVVRIVVALLGELGGVVELGIAGAQHVHADGRTRPIARPAVVRIVEVRGLESRERDLRDGVPHVAARADERHDGFGAVLLLNAARLLLDHVVGFVPADALPFAVVATELGIALHGIDDALRAVVVRRKLKELDGYAALRDGIRRIALDVMQLVVLVVQAKTPAYRMLPRRRPRAGTNHGIVALLPLPVAHSRYPFLTECASDPSARTLSSGRGLV